MKTAMLCLSLWAFPALAQIHLSVEVPVPSVRFVAPPPVVVVSPGIQVVENHDEEIFFVNNYYWMRCGRRWCRTPNHQGGWVVVEDRVVPPGIVRLPPGQYRRYRAARAAEAREDRREAREDRREAREDRREDRREAREDRRDAVHEADAVKGKRGKGHHK